MWYQSPVIFVKVFSRRGVQSCFRAAPWSVMLFKKIYIFWEQRHSVTRKKFPFIMKWLITYIVIGLVVGLLAHAPDSLYILRWTNGLSWMLSIEKLGKESVHCTNGGGEVNLCWDKKSFFITSSHWKIYRLSKTLWLTTLGEQLFFAEWIVNGDGEWAPFCSPVSNSCNTSMCWRW